MMLVGQLGRINNSFWIAHSKKVVATSNIGFYLLYLYLHPMSATLPPDWKALVCTHLGETPVTGRSSS